MRSHEIDYEIKGHDLQFVEVELNPQETVIAEAGAMLYMEEGIEFEAKMGDGKAFIHRDFLWPDKILISLIFMIICIC